MNAGSSAAEGPLRFRDARRTVVLVASGPSAGEADLERCRGWPTIVVNDAWRLAPWADVLYACDYEWWKFHHADVEAMFHGERWTQSGEAANAYGLKRILGKPATGLSTDPAWVHYNLNSGGQAMNLAYHFGARRFVLVGYDMGPSGKRTHFFGDHPKGLRNDSLWPHFVRAFGVIADDCRRLGLEVVNTSPISRLRCFPQATLEQTLNT